MNLIRNIYMILKKFWNIILYHVNFGIRNSITKRENMMISIKYIPECRIIYMRAVGPYGIDNALLMDRFKKWAEGEKLLDENSVLLGIAQDNPQEVKAAECRYDACLVVNEETRHINDSINETVLESGTYLVLTIPHTAEAIQMAYGNLNEIVKQQEVSIDISKPIIERYDMKLITIHLCEICIPVR